jgi:N4-gp56 family major capsid protein
MGQTVVGVGHPLARKLYSAALFAETIRKNGFRSKLTGPAPKQKGAEAKAKGQTNPGYPFVRVTDLSKTAGDTISVDLFNIITGKPVMGDNKLAGKMMSLNSSSMDISINQCRGGVDPGGRMTQQRTLHNLRSMSLANLSGWNNRLEDQLSLVHVAGARGYDQGEDWVVPLESDPDFDAIAVNPVLPPTRNRRFFADNANNSTVNTLAGTDLMTLEDIDALRSYLDDLVFPMQSVMLDGDMEAEENPLFVLYVSSRQWNDIQTNTSNTVWRTVLANAHARSNGFKHPLFMGTPGYWNGILIKKMWRPIRFNTGDLVREYDANDAIQSNAAGTDVDRAVLLGAQAMAYVYGRHQKSDTYYNWHEEETDHGNTVEVSTASMGGKSKLRFTGSNGEITDHGVMTFDTAIG